LQRDLAIAPTQLQGLGHAAQIGNGKSHHRLVPQNVLLRDSEAIEVRPGKLAESSNSLE
jgi:hypothetical protein